MAISSLSNVEFLPRGSIYPYFFEIYKEMFYGEEQSYYSGTAVRGGRVVRKSSVAAFQPIYQLDARQVESFEAQLEKEHAEFRRLVTQFNKLSYFFPTLLNPEAAFILPTEFKTLPGVITPSIVASPNRGIAEFRRRTYPEAVRIGARLDRVVEGLEELSEDIQTALQNPPLIGILVTFTDASRYWYFAYNLGTGVIAKMVELGYGQDGLGTLIQNNFAVYSGYSTPLVDIGDIDEYIERNTVGEIGLIRGLSR